MKKIKFYNLLTILLFGILIIKSCSKSTAENHSIYQDNILGKIVDSNYFDVSSEGNFGVVYQEIIDTTNCSSTGSSCFCQPIDSRIHFYNNSMEILWSKNFIEEIPIAIDYNNSSDLIYVGKKKMT